MRFSCYQQHPPLTPEQSKERRKARFLADLKAEVRQAANIKGLSSSDLARLLGCHRSVVSRALDPSTNVEVFTLFELAEVLGMEWAVSLRHRDQDLYAVLDIGTRNQHQYKVSQSPVISVVQNALNTNSSASKIINRSGQTFAKEDA